MNRLKVLKQTIKKVYKTGLFHSFLLGPDYLSFKDVHSNVYTLNTPDEIGFWFRIGKPHEYTQLLPTYESEYSTIGEVKKCTFIDNVTPMHTDNPDYVLRVCKSYLLN